MKRALFALLAIVFILSVQPVAFAGSAALPAVAANITKQCKLKPTSNASSIRKATDGNLRTAWTGREGDGQAIEITVGGGNAPGGIYFRWNAAPPAWTLVADAGDGDLIPVASGGGNGYLSDYAAIPAACSQYSKFTLRAEEYGKFSITELTVFGAGDRPAYVPKWQDFSGRVDVMVISAHPDDDQLYMGGVIPTYTEQGKTSVTVFMTYATAERRFEAMEGVWTAGGRVYPVLGPLPDRLVKTLPDAKRVWSETKVAAFIVEQVRKYKPAVIVTHDLKGEYRHGAHMLTAEVAREVFERSGDPDYYPESAAQYGVWNPAKLYLHKYKPNHLTLDTSVPLSVYGGMTAFQVAKAGYDRHKSQHKWSFKVTETGPHNIRTFGLSDTRVGLDNEHDNMFENVTPEAVAALNPQYVDKTALKFAVRSGASLVSSGYARLGFEAAGLQKALGHAGAVLDDAGAGQKDIDAEVSVIYAEMERILAGMGPMR